MAKFNLGFFKNINKNILSIGIAVVGIVVVLILIIASSNPNISFAQFGFGISKDKIAEKSINYINSNLLSGGQTASAVSVSEESGLVKVRIKIGTNEFDSYTTKDGKFLFPQAFNMDEVKKTAASNSNSTTAPTADQIEKTCDSTAKTDKPVLEAYIVSKCPFGLQMQRVLADVVQNAPDLAQNILVRYMGSITNGKIESMHGEEEAQENLRQICIRDEQNSKYWNYISCHIKAGDVDSCLAEASIDKTKLNSCITDAKRGLAYAKEDFDLNTKYSVTGSPTLILNGKDASEFDFGGRTSDAVKSMICCSSNTQPAVCSTTLNTAEAASSFSETYAGSGSSVNNNTNCAPAQ